MGENQNQVNEPVDKLFVATKAFIVNEGKVLLVRESGEYEEGTHEGKWVEPGGRLKVGEYFLDALKREVLEEVGIEVEIGNPFYADEWRPKVKGEQWQVVATFFLCEPKSLDVRLNQDHDSFRWVDFEEAMTMSILPETKKAFEALKQQGKIG